MLHLPHPLLVLSDFVLTRKLIQTKCPDIQFDLLRSGLCHWLSLDSTSRGHPFLGLVVATAILIADFHCQAIPIQVVLDTHEQACGFFKTIQSSHDINLGYAGTWHILGYYFHRYLLLKQRTLITRRKSLSNISWIPRKIFSSSLLADWALICSITSDTLYFGGMTITKWKRFIYIL